MLVFVVNVEVMTFMVSDIERIVATLLLLIGGQHRGVLQWHNYRT
jgi:hypothetical protein